VNTVTATFNTVLWDRWPRCLNEKNGVCCVHTDDKVAILVLPRNRHLILVTTVIWRRAKLKITERTIKPNRSWNLTFYTVPRLGCNQNDIGETKMSLGKRTKEYTGWMANWPPEKALQQNIVFMWVTERPLSNKMSLLKTTTGKVALLCRFFITTVSMRMNLGFYSYSES